MSIFDFFRPEFLSDWSRAWYPDGWLQQYSDNFYLLKPEIVIVFMLVGVASLVLFIAAPKIRIKIVFLAIFVWSLPGLLTWLLPLLIAIIGLAIIINVLYSWTQTPDYTAKRKDKNTWEVKRK